MTNLPLNLKMMIKLNDHPLRTYAFQLLQVFGSQINYGLATLCVCTYLLKSSQRLNNEFVDTNLGTEIHD